MRFTFRSGAEKKYTVPSEGPVSEESLRASVAGIINLMKDEDYPILTDTVGRVFCLPNMVELIAIEAKEIK